MELENVSPEVLDSTLLLNFLHHGSVGPYPCGDWYWISPLDNLLAEVESISSK